MLSIDYEKDFQEIEKDVDIIFTEVLSTFDKKIITSFIQKVQFFQTKISKNIQFLKSKQVKNKQDLEKIIKLDIYEYRLYITQTKIDLLESSIFSVIEGDKNKYNIINNEKQR